MGKDFYNTKDHPTLKNTKNICIIQRIIVPLQIK